MLRHGRARFDVHFARSNFHLWRSLLADQTALVFSGNFFFFRTYDCEPVHASVRRHISSTSAARFSDFRFLDSDFFRFFPNCPIGKFRRADSSRPVCWHTALPSAGGPRRIGHSDARGSVSRSSRFHSSVSIFSCSLKKASAFLIDIPPGLLNRCAPGHAFANSQQRGRAPMCSFGFDSVP